MSYCVNCGVELAKGEKCCPLCKLEVLNPLDPFRERSDRPYPKRVETLNKKVDKKFFVFIGSVVLLLPSIVTVLCEFIILREISWSIYVVGAMALLFVVCLVPMLFVNPKPELCVLLDSLALAGYLYVICLLSGGSWFWGLGLPIAASLGALASLLTWLFSRPRIHGILLKTALVLFSVSVFVVVLEIAIDSFVDGQLSLSWSVFTLIPCVLLGIIALLLRRKENLKDEIRKRFYV
ncbi:MAG: hypothetical protein RSE36_04150 [Oscillospiraceae bacterium]